MIKLINLLREVNMNDDVLMKLRAEKDKKLQQTISSKPKYNPLKMGNDKEKISYEKSMKSWENKVTQLERERKQILRDMEQEAEMEGGPIADEYGDKLNRIDKAISKLKQNKK